MNYQTDGNKSILKIMIIAMGGIILIGIIVILIIILSGLGKSSKLVAEDRDALRPAVEDEYSVFSATEDGYSVSRTAEDVDSFGTDGDDDVFDIFEESNSDGETAENYPDETPEDYSDETESMDVHAGEIPIYFAWASSQLIEGDDYGKYSTENLYDKDLSTAYVEGEEGFGDGVMVEFAFDGNRSYVVSQIEIHPGYQKNMVTFNKNSRPSELEFQFDDGTILREEIDYNSGENTTCIIDVTDRVGYPVVSAGCTMKLVHAISGNQYADTCISEMAFYSDPADATDAVMVDWQDSYENDAEECQVTAFKNGRKLWDYTCRNDKPTELSGASYVTTADNIVYVMDGFHLTALDAESGQKLWQNMEHSFGESAHAFDRERKILYVSGYYGPNLLGFDKSGKLVLNADDSEHYWPAIMMHNPEDNSLDLFYEGDMVTQRYHLGK